MRPYKNLRSAANRLYSPKPVIEYDADLVWAAACAAQRINGAYVKYTISPEARATFTPEQLTPENLATETNRDIINRLLAAVRNNHDSSDLTSNDRIQGSAVRQYYQALTFKVLRGDVLNSFNKTAMELAGKDVITSSYDIAVIASLPSCYERGIARDKADNKVAFATGGFIGKPGDKVSLKGEVLRSVFSQNYNIYFITAITDADQPVFFAHKNSLNPGTKIDFTGTVKAHRDTSTQLNRVKIKE